LHGAIYEQARATPPALQNDDLIGIISIGDVVKAVIAEQESTIRHLENYITGGR